VSGADNEGIVHGVADSVASLGINIIEVITDTQNAPVTGSTLFHMVAKIYLGKDKKDELSKKLSEIETDFGLGVQLERI
jgi:glycine cleavage system regulatory protein